MAQSAASAAWLTAWATVGLVVVAILTALYARRQLNEAAEAREQARELADEVAQPYVVAFMEPSAASPQLIDLVIRNFGQTGANNIRVTSSPKLQQSSESGAPPDDVVLPKPIPFLAPGQEWRVFWDSGLTRKDSGLPDSHTVVVTYADSQGRRSSSASVLDFQAHEGRSWVDVKSIHDVAKALKEVENLLKSFKEGPRGGVNVWVRSGDAKDQHTQEHLAPSAGRQDKLRLSAMKRDG
ncbi:hypothetical protein [Rhodococcus sp. ACT016]|uniref:hypothetical protein n=1 Tax=Rhodococcus sp. ACT016 TaxID=3134808 RepID=UPI003D2AB197